MANCGNNCIFFHKVKMIVSMWIKTVTADAASFEQNWTALQYEN
jgi:hypothetical protein